MKCDAELTKNRMHKCGKGTRFTWMLNKRAPSSCHTVTCALFVCGYCLSLWALGGEMSVCSLLTAYSLCQTSLGHASEQAHTNNTHKRSLSQSSLPVTYTHTHTYKPLLSQWLFDHSTFCQSVSNALDWCKIVMQPTRTEGTRLNEYKKIMINEQQIFGH